MKRSLSFILALILTLTISGCSNKVKENSNENAEAATEQLQSETQQQAQQSDEPQQEQPGQDEEVSKDTPPAKNAEPSAEPTQQQAAVVSYPLSDGSVSLTIFDSIHGGYSAILTTWYDTPTLPYVEEATGIKLEFVEPSGQTRTEQFNLMIASGDWVDIFNSNMYNGGAAQAFNDDVTFELTDLLAEFAPNYTAAISELDFNSYANLVDDDGRMLFMSDLRLSSGSGMGLAIRQDWLDELGLDVPDTTSELKDVLAAFAQAYSCDRAFHVEGNGIMTAVVGAFGVSGFNLEATDGIGLYKDGQTVLSSLQSDGYREYIEYLIDLYSEGLLHKEFYNFTSSPEIMQQISLYGASGIWEVDPNNLLNTIKMAREDNPDYNLLPSTLVVKEKGDTYHFNAISTSTATTGSVITTTCKEPEMAISFIDWFFTETGKNLAVYGIEGLCYTVDSGGNVVFTDFIMNNPEGLQANNLQEAYSYTWSLASYSDSTLFNYTYEQELSDRLKLWDEGDSLNTMPSLTLTTSETDRYTALSTEIATHAAETILKWIVGEEALTDKSWQALQDEIENIGISECLDIYQGAYDRYLERGLVA